MVVKPSEPPAATSLSCSWDASSRGIAIFLLLDDAAASFCSAGGSSAAAAGERVPNSNHGHARSRWRATFCLPFMKEYSYP